MNNVRRKPLSRQRGISLVELLVASSVGLLALGAVGTVFISGQNLASERSKQLMLAQDINDAIHFIKTDIQRAGYNSNKTGSLVLSGATSTILVPAEKNALSYMYEDETGQWRVVKFREISSPPTIQLCVDRISKGITTLPVDASCGSGKVTSLIDYKYFELKDFTVTATPLVTSSANSTMLDISLTVAFKNKSYSKTVSTQVKARNWN